MDGIYESVLPYYRSLKNFPEKTLIPTTSNRKNNIAFNAKTDWKIIAGFGFIISIFMMMIIASLINYEVMFRVKARNATKGNKKVDFYKEFYSTPENKTGRNFYAPIISFMIAIFFVGYVYHMNSTK